MYIKKYNQDFTIDTTLKKLGIRMIEKINNNVFVCVDLIPKVIEAHQIYLPYGLVLRGIVSDIINYLYLHQVYANVGNDAFEGELKILDLEFVKAYQKFFNSNNKMYPKDPYQEKKIEQELMDKFKGFFEDGKLVNSKKFRVNKMVDVIEKLRHDKVLIGGARIETEAGKLHYINNPNIEGLKIVYTYLSQLQHFSTYSYLHYSEKRSGFLNPHISLLVVHLVNSVLTLIVTDIYFDKVAVESFTQIQIKIADLTH